MPDYFLRFTDYGGRVLTGDSGTQWFQVLDASFGSSIPLSIGSQSTGVGAGRLTFEPLSLTLSSSRGATVLDQMLSSGTPFRTVELVGYRDGGAGPLKVSTDLFKLAGVASDSIDILTGDHKVALQYGGLVHSVIDYFGTVPTGTVTAGWNAVANVVDDSLTTILGAPGSAPLGPDLFPPRTSIRAAGETPIQAAGGVRDEQRAVVQFRNLDGSFLPALGDTWLDVVDGGFARSQTLNITGVPGAGAGRVTFDPLELSFKPGSFGPTLDRLLASGTALQIEVATYTFSGILADDYQFGLAAAKTSSVSQDEEEGFAFTYTFEYGAQRTIHHVAGADGRDVGTEVEGWNRIGNVRQVVPEAGTYSESNAPSLVGGIRPFFGLTVVGTDGNDVLAGTDGPNVFIGRLGVDTVSYAGSRSGLVLAPGVLTEGPATGDAADTFNSIERFVLSPFDDEFIGVDPSDDLALLTTLTVNDDVSGGAGKDKLSGRGGDDILRGDSGNDTLDGGSGNDSLFGGLGNDVLIGGTGDDALAGDGGSDALQGGSGNDRYLFQGSDLGSDTVSDSSGAADAIVVDKLSDVLDSVRSGKDLVLTLSTGMVTILNHFVAGSEIDQLRTATGSAVVTLATGLVGGGSAGIISGSDAGETLDGRGGDDLLYGAGGNDLLLGGTGADLLDGGAAEDILDGGPGSDTLTGGTGRDAFLVRIGGGDDLITDFRRGEDKVWMKVAALDPTAGVSIVRDGADTVLSLPGGRVRVAGVADLDASDLVLHGGGPSSLFVDDGFYLAANRDVLAAGLDPSAHYLSFGVRENRDPNALFSAKGYLSANPDVAGAGAAPLSHYLASGAGEGRDPSALFDDEAYLRANPDVGAAGLNPLAHYLAFGRDEGRGTFPATGARSSAADGPRDDIAPNGFDRQHYLMTNPDVGSSRADAAAHFEAFGWREGRDPNAYFDTKAYLDTNPDVRAAGVNPLEHYHQLGFREDRNPSARFDTSQYLDANPDVRRAGIDPLVHYLEFGRAEGRAAYEDGALLI